MREKEFYKEQIIKMVQKIENCDILEYIYIFLKGKLARYFNERTGNGFSDNGRNE